MLLKECGGLFPLCLFPTHVDLTEFPVCALLTIQLAELLAEDPHAVSCEDQGHLQYSQFCHYRLPVSPRLVLWEDEGSLDELSPALPMLG